MALGTLVGRGFVRIDADTAPARKAIQALGALGSLGGGLAGGALGAQLVAPVVTAVMGLASAFAVAGGAATAFGAAVVPQFQEVSKAMQGQKVADDARTKAAINASIAQDIAKKHGFEYGKQVEITKDMTASAKDAAQEYNSALSASKSASKTATQAQALYKQQLDSMAPATRQTAEHLLKLKDETQAWSRALAGNTMPIFTRGIDLIRGLLPKLTPIVKDTAFTIQRFLATLGQGVAGKVFREFGDNVGKRGPTMLRAFLDTVRNVIVGVVGLFNAFAPASAKVTGGLSRMTLKFAEWSAGLGKSKGFQKFLADARSTVPGLVKTFGDLIKVAVSAVAALGPLAGVSLQIAQAFASLLAALPTEVLKLLVQAIILTNVALKLYAIYTAAAAAATWLHNNANIVGRASLVALQFQLIALSIQQRAVALWTGVVTAAQWAWNVAMNANPIALMVIAIAALVAGIVFLATKTKFFQTVWNAVWGGVKTAVTGFINWLKSNWQLVIWTILTGGIGLAVAMIVRHWDGVKRAFSVTINWVKNNWPLILAILTGPIGIAVLMIVRHWDGVKNAFKSAFKAVAGFATDLGKTLGDFFSKLPDRLANFFSTLPGKVGKFFMEAGKNAIQFFASLPGKARNAAVGSGATLLSVGSDLIKGFFKGASDFFTKSVPGFFKMVWRGVVDFFKNIFGISSPSTVMAVLGVDLMRGLLVGMLRIASTIGGWLLKNVRDPVIKFFSGAISWLISAGRNIVLGMLRGQAMIAVTIAGWLIRNVRNPTVNFFSRAVSWLLTAGRNTISGLISGAKDRWGAMVEWLRDRPGAFRSALGNMTEALLGKGRDVISGFLSGLKDKWDDAIDWIRGIKDRIVGAIKSAFGIHSPARAMIPLGFNIMAGLMKGLLSGSGILKSAVKTIFGSLSGVLSNGGDLLGDLIGSIGGSIGLGASGGAGRFKGIVALALRMLGQPIGLMGTVLRRMNQESGGNPSIVNKWDSNWKAGTPSVGLMQVIGPTFRAYAGKYRNKGPFLYGVSIDPLANIYASMRYAISRYGSLANAYNRPGGYDLGGVARGVGMMMKMTNQPERVLSPRQTAAFERLVPALTNVRSGGGGVTIVVEKLVLENKGILGSRHEVENWLITAFEQLQRQGRIRVVTR